MTTYGSFSDALTAAGGDETRIWNDVGVYYVVQALAIEPPPAAADLSVLVTAAGASMLGFQQVGSGAVLTTVQEVLKDKVSPKQFYQQSDNGDYGPAFQRAAATGKQIWMDGSNYTVSRIVLSVDCEIFGSGKIVKLPNTFGHLIQTTKSLRIKGNITLDPNRANNADGSITSTSACAITHTGPALELEGVTILDTHSAAIKTSATQRLSLRRLDIFGGWLNVLATVGTECHVEIVGGWYRDSRVDDAVQVLNSGKFTISGVVTSNPGRSGIVVSNAAGLGSISGCLCYGGHSDANNQGGWGIVCSVSVHDVSITGNICFGNERGPLCVDTYTTATPSYTDAHITITGNVLDGEYNGDYGTTGIALNGCRRVTVSGNRVRKVSQHVLAVDPYLTVITNNVFEDCGAGYFVQVISGYHCVISGNVCRTATEASNAAVINVFNSYVVEIERNKLWTLDTDRHAIRIDGCQDWSVTDNRVYKATNGGSFLLVAGASPHGRIARNYIRAHNSIGFSYFINGQGTVPTDIYSEGNELNQQFSTLTCETYINAGASIYARGDIVNGVIDCYNTTPTGHKFYNGSSALIAGVRKTWDGSAWV